MYRRELNKKGERVKEKKKKRNFITDQDLIRSNKGK